MRRTLILGGLTAASLRATGLAFAQPQPAGQMLARASASVLKIDAGNHSATGFLWPDASHVVTALHVVDGAPRIVGHQVDRQGRITASHALAVERVLKDSDLVLLRLPAALPSPPLAASAGAPAVKQSLDALGFPLNIPGASNIEVKVRFGGTQLRSILPPKVLEQLAEYPSPAAEILNLEGNLVPGISGAPLLDAEGRVAGIANGGLEEGALGICWGIPATQLARLQQSADTRLPGAPRVAQLFAADLQADVKTLPRLAGVTLTKLRSRSFLQLAATADDQLGLAQLGNVFQGFQPASFRYDVYQDLSTGASVAVPEGARLFEQGDFIAVQAGDGRMAMLLQVLPVRSLDEAQRVSLQFEQRITGYGTPGTNVMADPAWSYLQPMQRSGVIVNRKAAYRLRMVGGQWLRDAYFFGTEASNGRAFLGVAALNHDDSPMTNLREMSCFQGPNQPGCQQVIAQRRLWAQMVLGAQFSTFPQQG